MKETCARNVWSWGTPITKQEIASKLVQEIARNNAEVPERYRHKDGFPEAIEDHDLWWNHLLIDFNLLSSFSIPELEKLRFALSEWGCFQVINHGIESSFLEELIEVFRQFFELPLEEKLEYATEDDALEGYGSDSFYAGTRTLGWNDRLYLSLYPKEKLKLKYWPQRPKKLRGMIEDYSKKLTTMNEGILKAVARSLDLQEDSFLTQRKYIGPTNARINFYPRCSYPNRVLGSSPHSDETVLTYVLPEKEVEGLEILKDGQWYKVSVIPGALFINFGDLGEIMTNGLFKSPVHRVVTNSERARISVVMFLFPDDDEEVEPLCELVNEHQPQVYKKLKMSEFQQLVFETFALGSKLLDSLRV